MAINVFVYGTLLSGRSNHHILSENQAKGGMPAVLAGYALYQVAPWYPGIVPRPGRKVLGEVYEVSPELLARLDRLEGVDAGLYRRESAIVKTEELMVHEEATLGKGGCNPMTNRLTNIFILLLVLGAMFGGYYLANHGPHWELVPPNLTWLDPIYWRSDLDNMTPEELVKWTTYQFVNGHVVRSADALTKEYRDRVIENKRNFEKHWDDMGLRYIIVNLEMERIVDTPNRVVIRSRGIAWAQDLTIKQPLTKVESAAEWELVKEGGGWRIDSQKSLYARRLSPQ